MLCHRLVTKRFCVQFVAKLFSDLMKIENGQNKLKLNRKKCLAIKVFVANVVAKLFSNFKNSKWPNFGDKSGDKAF